MFIEIMYADFDSEGKLVGTPRVRNPIEDIGTMRKTAVVFITLTTKWGDRRALVSRMWSKRNIDGPGWWGEDNYAIGFIAGRFFTRQWADEDEFLLTRSLADPNNTTVQRHPVKVMNWPDAAEVHVFKGAYIPDDDWKIALQVFEKEMF